MAEISRRNFLIKGGAGAAALGAVAVLPSVQRRIGDADKADALKVNRPSATTAGAPSSSRTATEQLVAYIPDPKSGEIHYLVGTREVIHKDPALVAQMLRNVN